MAEKRGLKMTTTKYFKYKCISISRVIVLKLYFLINIFLSVR